MCYTEQEKDEKGSGRHSIGIKGIVATLLVCASVLGLILVGTYVIPRYLSLQTARVAFYMQNYEETAMRLRGRKLSDSDRIMFEKASLIYGLQERYHQYEIYHQRGMVKEALNQLLQGVAACEKESILAQQLGIEAEWQTQRDLFVNALQTEYGLDSATVDIVSALRNPDYTVAVQNILSGRPYNDKSSYGGEVDLDIIPEEEPEVPAEDKLEDLLPEEEAILEQLQQENEQVSETVEPQSESAQEGKELYSGTVNGGSVNFVN